MSTPFGTLSEILIVLGGVLWIPSEIFQGPGKCLYIPYEHLENPMEFLGFHIHIFMVDSCKGLVITIDLLHLNLN